MDWFWKLIVGIFTVVGMVFLIGIAIIALIIAFIGLIFGGINAFVALF